MSLSDPSTAYHRSLGPVLSSQTPYVVLLGDVGTGKSTIVEKLTDELGRSSDGSSSFTHSSEPFWVYDGSMVICDTPGSNALKDRLEHNVHIAHALNFNPVWKILIIVKADTRIDNVVDDIRKYAERLLDLPMEILAVLVTHMDMVTWQPEEFKEHLERELGIEYAAFSGLHTPRDVLLGDLSEICSGEGHKITIDDENFLKIFKINDNRLKIIKSTKREVESFKKQKIDFDEQRRSYQGKDLDDLIFEFQAYMRQEIIEAQKRVSEENGFEFYGPNAANEAGHLANMTNQMRMVLYDIRVEAAKHQSHHGVSEARRCVHCNLIWTKVEGCDGATTCGNRPSAAIDVRDASYGVLGTYSFKRVTGALKIFKTGQRTIRSKMPADKYYGCGKEIFWNQLPVVEIPAEVRESPAVTMEDDIPVLSDEVRGATGFKRFLKSMLSPLSCGLFLKEKPKKK